MMLIYKDLVCPKKSTYLFSWGEILTSKEILTLNLVHISKCIILLKLTN